MPLSSAFATGDQLEAEGLVNLRRSEVVEIDEFFAASAGTEVLGQRLGAHVADRWLPERPTRVHEHFGSPHIRLEAADNIADVFDSRAEPLRRVGEHELTVAHHHESQRLLQPDLLLDDAYELAAFDVQERARMRERIAAKLLAEFQDGRSQSVHRHVSAEASQKSHLDHLAFR